MVALAQVRICVCALARNSRHSTPDSGSCYLSCIKIFLGRYFHLRQRVYCSTESESATATVQLQLLISLTETLMCTLYLTVNFGRHMP